jgi:hypothetical protein
MVSVIREPKTVGWAAVPAIAPVGEATCQLARIHVTDFSFESQKSEPRPSESSQLGTSTPTAYSRARLGFGIARRSPREDTKAKARPGETSGDFG